VDRVQLQPQARPTLYTFANRTRLDGVRVGVCASTWTRTCSRWPNSETIDIVDAAIAELAKLGATIVDPGEHAALCQKQVDRIVPEWRISCSSSSSPNVFPVDSTVRRRNDHITTYSTCTSDYAGAAPRPTGQPSLRKPRRRRRRRGRHALLYQPVSSDRGDAEIKTLTDLYTKANFWKDPNFRTARPG